MMSNLMDRGLTGRSATSRGCAAIFALLSVAGCAPKASTCLQFPPAPIYEPDHAYTLDELVEVSVHRNNSLDVARYEAESVAGLVDQVKALWLPQLRYDFAFVGFSNDYNYKANAFGVASINVPVGGAYNVINSAGFAQIISTGGKRTSGLKQARMYECVKRLEVLRQEDQVAFDVANYYHLVCLTSDLDAILEDGERRLKVFRQVAQNLNRLGSLRASNVDTLESDLLLSEFQQFRLALQAGRQQAYEALRHYVGVNRDESLLLKESSLPAALNLADIVSASRVIADGFVARPETRQVSLFTHIRQEQVKFAKAQWAPNIALLGAYTDIQGNHHTILEQIDGLVASLLVDLPIYDAGRLGKLREALGLEQASLSFQKEVEDLITLEIDVTAVESQRALATIFKAVRARQLAREHYLATRQAYSRELVPASSVVIALALDVFAQAQEKLALFAYDNARAAIKRVTADREMRYGY